MEKLTKGQAEGALSDLLTSYFRRGIVHEKDRKDLKLRLEILNLFLNAHLQIEKMKE